MSDRPTPGRRPRGASRAAFDADPPAASDTQATALPEEELEDASRNRPRGNRAARKPARAETRYEEPASGATRIMSTDDIDGAPDDGGEDVEATHAGPPISVEVLEGPDAGKKKRVRGGRMVIGRGDGCDLKLRDTACSRRHLELIVGFSGAVVRDLGSGNGTLVNGSRVDEVQVGHGDEVQVGTTVLKIVDELAALEERRKPKVEPPPQVEPADLEPGTDGEGEELEGPPDTLMRAAPQAPSTAAVSLPLLGGVQKKWVIVGASASAAVLLLLMVVVLRAKPKPPPPPKIDETRVVELVKEGKAALLAGDYDKASADWDAVEKLEKDYADLPDLRARTASEKAAHGYLDAAKTAIAEHRYEDAREKLRHIEPAALCYDQATTLIKSLDGLQTAYLADLGAQKLAAGDLDGAREVVPQLQPLDAGAADKLSRDIETAQANAEAEQIKHIKNKRQRERAQREMRRRKAEAAVRAELESGYRKFRDASTPGGYSRAANEFEHIAEETRNSTAASRARSLTTKVREFSKVLTTADSLEHDQSYEAEVKPLSSAISLLADIDSSNPLMGKLKNRLVRGLVLKGHNAAARQDYGLAAKSFGDALRLKPNDGQAKEGLIRLHGRAQEVYLQAYEEESRDPANARKLYNAVLQMVSPNEELSQKAKHRLEIMARGDNY